MATRRYFQLGLLLVPPKNLLIISQKFAIVDHFICQSYEGKVGIQRKPLRKILLYNTLHVGRDMFKKLDTESCLMLFALKWLNLRKAHWMTLARKTNGSTNGMKSQTRQQHQELPMPSSPNPIQIFEFTGQ